MSQPTTTTATSVQVAQLEKSAFILKTIAHPIRLGIIELLHENEKLSVGQICQRLGAEQSLISHHLSNMKIIGLLSSKREGKNVFYSLQEPRLLKILDCLRDCGCNS